MVDVHAAFALVGIPLFGCTFPIFCNAVTIGHKLDCVVVGVAAAVVTGCTVAAAVVPGAAVVNGLIVATLADAVVAGDN